MVKANWATIGKVGNPSTASWQSQNLTTVTVGGASWTVYKPAAADFKGFLEDLHSSGYSLNSSGGFNYRGITGNPSKLSQHAFGNAIDINADANPYGSHQTDLPSNVGELAAKHNLVNGADFSNPDPMHFEWKGPGAVSVAQADTGGNQPVADPGESNADFAGYTSTGDAGNPAAADAGTGGTTALGADAAGNETSSPWDPVNIPTPKVTATASTVPGAINQQSVQAAQTGAQLADATTAAASTLAQTQAASTQASLGTVGGWIAQMQSWLGDWIARAIVVLLGLLLIGGALWLLAKNPDVTVVPKGLVPA